MISSFANDSGYPWPGCSIGSEDFDKLDAALDFESTGRRATAQKALHLMVRGSHVSGFILRPDDGLSDVAIVCNGAVRWLSPAEFQWLMHESRSPITMDGEALAWKRMAERFRPFVHDPRKDWFHAGFLETDEIEEWNNRGDLLDEFDRMMASPTNLPLDSSERDAEFEKLRAENAKLREAAQEVVWSWVEATGHEDLPQCLMVSRAAVEGSIAGLEEALT